MKILVTGANGYIGQGVVKTLCDKNIDVVATDFHTDLVDCRAARCDKDLFSLEDPYSYFDKPDCCIHLAWRDGFKHQSENHLKDLPFHYSFLEKLAKSGIKKLAVLGSMHEVGFFEGCIKEESPCNPLSLYGISKNALRNACLLLSKSYYFQLLWLRGYYIVGNTHSGCSIFSKITKAAESGEKFFPFTMGENQFDFIDYDLFCNQIVCACLQDKISGVIECCSGKPVKLSERVEQFIHENNYDIKLNYGAFPDRPYDSKAVWGDNSKINKIMKC